MAEQPKTQSEVLELVEEHGVRFVHLWFTDVLGHLKSFSINSSELEGAFERGIGFDGASMTGFNPVEESDMFARPAPETFSLIPWRPEGVNAVARMYCSIEFSGGRPYEGDPRWILSSALERAAEMGFDDYLISPELEFYYFASSRPADGVPEVLDEGGYFDLTTLDAGSEVRRETVLALERMGVHVASSHHEAGPSQHELDIRSSGAMEAADNVMTAKIVVKEYAVQEGWHATFMPKPLGPVNGSGMHLHQSLTRDGADAFHDAGRPDGLSATAGSFIAGQLRHAREISPLYAQWVNSYKRLVPGFEAPVYPSWSHRNRSSLIRVSRGQAAGGAGTRVELRCPDPACNPYLCMAGMLQAGLEGIEKGYELPDPMEENLYHLDPEEMARRGIERLPATLGEALDIAADSELVLRTLGEHTFRRFIDLKRQEWDSYRIQVTPFEVERFLPVL